MTWHDARNDPLNNNTQFFGAVSHNGGVPFGANFQISAGTSNDDTAASSTDYGDYTSSDFHNGKLHVIWADNSNSTGDNPAGANSTFDMYTADMYTAAITIAPTPQLTALSPAKVWIGLKNSDDIGTRVDLLAEALIGNSKVGEGQVNNFVFPRSLRLGWSRSRRRPASPQGKIVRDQLERAKAGSPRQSFMRLAGSVRGPRDLSSRKGFARS